jgi:hypothetical protein
MREANIFIGSYEVTALKAAAAAAMAKMVK